jgi:hypothetical protein
MLPCTSAVVQMFDRAERKANRNVRALRRMREIGVAETKMDISKHFRPPITLGYLVRRLVSVSVFKDTRRSRIPACAFPLPFFANYDHFHRSPSCPREKFYGDRIGRADLAVRSVRDGILRYAMASVNAVPASAG